MKFENFRKVIKDNIQTDENSLRLFITEKLAKLPIPTVEVNKNTFIERGVLISKDDQKFDLSRLSYIPNELKEHAKEGRFNNKKESIFYAAFTDLESPHSTRYFLATELDHSILENQNKTFNITITKWLSVEGFTSIFLLFNEEFCTNSLTRNALNEIRNQEVFKKLKKEDIEFFELITEEIAKKNSNNKYIITNIVFDFYKQKGYKAIIYPGVRSNYRGNNIAMLPEVTDKNWNCYLGAEFKLTQIHDIIKIDVLHKINIKNKKLIYCKFGKSEIGEETTIKR